MVNFNTLSTTSVDKIKAEENSDINVKTIYIERDTDTTFCVTGLVEDPTVEPISEYWEKEVRVEDKDLTEFISKEINLFESNVDVSESVVQVSSIELRFSPDLSEKRITMPVSIQTTVSDEKIAELRSMLFEVNNAIPSEDSLHTMSVRMMNYTKDTKKPPNYDFTIYFTTETPHKYWANCDTLEDYFEMVAKNNDDMTLQDIREEDTYYSHTHMRGDNKVADWIQDCFKQLIDEHISTSENIEVSNSKFEVQFSKNEITFNCNIYKSV